MTQTDKMLSRKEAGVGIVTFNNPERHNAVSLEMWEAAKEMLDAFAADSEVRVVVLTGAGGKAFVSGADISKPRRRPTCQSHGTRPLDRVAVESRPHRRKSRDRLQTRSLSTPCA